MKSMKHIFDELKNDAIFKGSDPKQYFDRTNVLVYMEDAVSQLLQQKDEVPRINANKFFFNYFTSVKRGSHTLFREFNFVSATLHNRLSFIKNYWKSFTNIGKKGELTSAEEYHSFALLLCPDFPWSIIQKSFKIPMMGESEGSLLSYPDFLYSFHLQFCYDDFIVRCQKTFSSLTNSTEKRAEQEGNNKVDSTKFLRRIKTFHRDEAIDCPPITIIEEILQQYDQISFAQFLYSLMQHKELIRHTGALPARSHLCECDDSQPNMLVAV